MNGFESFQSWVEGLVLRLVSWMKLLIVDLGRSWFFPISLLYDCYVEFSSPPWLSSAVPGV